MTDDATRTDPRASELDREIGAFQPSQQITDELFAVVDLLDDQPSLRRAFTDPGRPADQRGELTRALLGGRIGEQALRVVTTAVGLRWASGRALADALERQAVRCELAAALAAGTLDRVEEELFRFERLVASDGALRDAIGDRQVPLEPRRALVADLLRDKTDEATQRLSARAVAARERTFGLTLERYLALAAELRRRIVAQVTVARPLEADQERRLREALSRQAGRDVDLQVTVDPSVLGGVRVQLGDQVIEGTVAARLKAASDELKKQN